MPQYQKYFPVEEQLIYCPKQFALVFFFFGNLSFSKSGRSSFVILWVFFFFGILSFSKSGRSSFLILLEVRLLLFLVTLKILEEREEFFYNFMGFLFLWEIKFFEEREELFCNFMGSSFAAFPCYFKDFRRAGGALL